MKKIIILFLAIMCFTGLTYGQGKTYKEMKTLKKQIPFSVGEKLLVQGERTFLTVQSWDKNYLEATIEVIARHGDQQQAKKDLEKIQLIFTKKGKTHVYSNAIQISDPSQKPKSNLKVKVQLKIPAYALLVIDNHFGNIRIEGPLKSLHSTSDFTNISIQNFSGQAEVNTKFGDTDIRNVTGALKIDADRSNLNLQAIQGTLLVNIKYGELDIFYDNPLQDYQIQAKHAPIKLHIPANLDQNIALECNQCAINANDESLLSNKKYNEDRSSARIINSGAQSKGEIVSELENINIIFETDQTSSN